MNCQVCGEIFDKAHNWGYYGYAVCPLCARKMTEKDWDDLMDDQEPMAKEQINEAKSVLE